ncbi:MAG: hypothetical protein ACP5VE_11485 [Chthonomonadales bacterium]
MAMKGTLNSEVRGFGAMAQWGSIPSLALTLTAISCLPQRTHASMGVSGAPAASNGVIKIQAVGSSGSWAGFRVSSGGRVVAEVHLSSRGLITARQCQADRRHSSLTFRGLQGAPASGLKLGGTDEIQVMLRPRDRYPRVRFDLTIRAFDEQQWTSFAGKEPFHFLCLLLSDAEAWHQRGWLNATPLADPFPLLEDVHVGSPEISAYHYNRTWSYTPPLSAHPIPVIGLWAPSRAHYVGMEFITTRLEGNSERNIATGYHWRPRGNRGGQYVALVYPYGGTGYQTLMLPKPGDHIASRCVLIWSLSLPATDDPNRFVLNYLWQRDRDLLPRVPPIVDLSWLPGGIRLQDFEGPPPGGLINGVEGQFQIPGSQLIGGWRWHNESAVQVARARGDQARLEDLEAEAQRLLKYAKRFRVQGDTCVYWEKPLTGRWTDQWGGAAVTTLHNANGFAAGRLFLDLYRDCGKSQYRSIADGVLNWAKHIAWTRNEFADVPSSPFAIGGTLSASFCLDYYTTFKHAADVRHRQMAQIALQLARSFTYRYMVMWLGDNSRWDNLDASFLWEPNSGRDWTGAACANEVFWNLDTLAQTAVDTGDPILMWALQGSLNRWYQLYQEKYKDRLADYQPSDMTEGYGLAPGNVYGLGSRAPYGFASPLAMIEPVGDTLVRVLAGERAAMVFAKNRVTVAVADYRNSGDGNLAFTLKADGPYTPNQPFSISLTVPYVDISTKAVRIIRNGRTHVLVPGADVIRPPQALWSLRINDVAVGDRILVGKLDPAAPILPSAPPLIQRDASSVQGMDHQARTFFEPVVLPFDARPDVSWEHLNAWAGLPRGLLWAWGIPFQLAPYGAPSVLAGPIHLRPPVREGAWYALLYSDGNGPRPALVGRGGRRWAAQQNLEAQAWRAWPPIYHQRLLLSLVHADGEVTGVDPGGRQVWALTGILPAAEHSGELQRILDHLQEKGVPEWASLRENEARVAILRKELSSIQGAPIAILPPNPGGSVMNLAMKAGMMQHAAELTAEQLAQPGTLDAARFRVALYADGEDYVHTVHSPGDAAMAVVRYVQEGGTLVLAASQPLPFCYAMGPGFHRSEPLGGRFGMPLYNAIETLPGEDLRVEFLPGASLLGRFPASVPYPAGDPRLRCVDRSAIPPDARYTPIARVVGRSGKDYGDAAALVEWPHGGRVLYVSDVLLRLPDVPEAVVRWIAHAAGG